MSGKPDLEEVFVSCAVPPLLTGLGIGGISTIIRLLFFVEEFDAAGNIVLGTFFGYILSGGITGFGVGLIAFSICWGYFALVAPWKGKKEKNNLLKAELNKSLDYFNNYLANCEHQEGLVDLTSGIEKINNAREMIK